MAVGAVKTVFTIVQSFQSLLETSSTFNVSPAEQDILIPIKSNLTYTVTPAADSPWITVISLRGAPEEGTIKVHVAANTGLGPRTGSFTLAAPDYAQTYMVVQSASWTPAETAEAVYIANSQDIYDSETYAINLHQQYVVKLATEDGDQVTLVLNKKGEVKDDAFSFFPTDKVPQGTFEIDATGKKEDNTFSIKSSTGEEKYFTGLVVGGQELLVYDGEIVVEEADGAYTVTAILVDAAGAQHNYSYVGPIAITNDFRGGHATVNWKNTYETHFTTKANGWYAEFYHPIENPAGKDQVSYASFSFFSNAGEVDLNDLPDGTYTFAAAENDPELKYKTGTLKANPGLLSNVSISLYKADGSISYTNVSKEGTTLTITKNADGTKNFKYSATVTPYHYDADYNLVNDDPVQVAIDIDVPLSKATDTQNHPYDDGDDVFATLEGPAGTVYVGYWYSKYIGVMEDGSTPKPAIPDTECNIFAIGSNSYFNNAWSMFISVIAGEGWTFEKNYASRFCSTPVPDGTYTFGTEAKIGALIPLKQGSASRCYVQNTYTGTTYYPVSGFVKLDNGTITVDLVCKATETALQGRPNSPASVHFTGSTAFSCSYLQDYSALNRVKTLSISSPVPIEDSAR